MTTAAPATTETPAAAPATTATPAVTPASTTATPAVTPASTTATPATTATTATPPVTPAAAPNDKGTKPQGVPEKYEFKAPDGVTFDDKVINTFSEAAKDAGLTQEKAQAFLDKMHPAIAARQVEQLETYKTQWTDASKADKEFGGDKFDENLAVAIKARDAFATPELRKLLDDTGLGNHPEVIRLFYRTGKAMSEDGFVNGKKPVGDAGKAQALYTKTEMNP